MMEQQSANSKMLFYAALGRNPEKNLHIVKWIMHRLGACERSKCSIVFLHVITTQMRVQTPLCSMFIEEVNDRLGPGMKTEKQKKLLKKTFGEVYRHCKDIENQTKIIECDDPRKGLVEAIARLQIPLLIIGKSKSRIVSYLKDRAPRCEIMIVRREVSRGMEIFAGDSFHCTGQTSPERHDAAALSLSVSSSDARRGGRNTKIEFTTFYWQHNNSLASSDEVVMCKASNSAYSSSSSSPVAVAGQAQMDQFPNPMEMDDDEKEDQFHSVQSTMYFDCNAGPSSSGPQAAADMPYLVPHLNRLEECPPPSETMAGKDAEMEETNIVDVLTRQVYELTSQLQQAKQREVKLLNTLLWLQLEKLVKKP